MAPPPRSLSPSLTPPPPSVPEAQRQTHGKKEKQTIPLKCDRQPRTAVHTGSSGRLWQRPGSRWLSGTGPYPEVPCPEMSPKQQSEQQPEAGAEGRAARTAVATHLQHQPQRERGAGHACSGTAAQVSTKDRGLGAEGAEALLPAALGQGSWLTGPREPCAQPAGAPTKEQWDQADGTGFQSARPSREW